MFFLTQNVKSNHSPGKSIHTFHRRFPASLENWSSRRVRKPFTASLIDKIDEKVFFV